MMFRDRRDAGQRLGSLLAKEPGNADAVVLALPRGGVPVGSEIALALGAPLDIFLVRKLGTPGYEELAMGAIASGGVRVINDRVIQEMGVSAVEVEAATRRERAELERRELAYRDGRPPIELAGRTVILVDDGVATGSSMMAAIQAVRRHRPARVVVAVPVAPPDTCRELASAADDVVCLATPAWFRGVGQFYDDFAQLTDEDVRASLARSSPATLDSPSRTGDIVRTSVPPDP